MVPLWLLDEVIMCIVAFFDPKDKQEPSVEISIKDRYMKGPYISITPYYGNL